MVRLGNGLLLAPALVTLALWPAEWHAWAIRAGSPWGWIALLLALAAVACREAQLGRRLRAQAVGLVGMAAVGLLACTVRAVWPDAPDWAYRTLMLGWATYAVLVVAASWWLAMRRMVSGGEEGQQDLVRAASYWTAVSGILAVLLGLKAAFFHDPWEELLWASTAIALAAAACVTMAAWRRAAGWAFTAALGVNLAASLVVWYCEWHSRRQLTLEDWWVHLAQANAIASAVAAMIWLAARRWLDSHRESDASHQRPVGDSDSAGSRGHRDCLDPGVGTHRVDARAASAMGRAVGRARGMGCFGLGRRIGRVVSLPYSPRELLHVVAGAGLGAGTLAACSSMKWNLGTPWGDWLVYHVLESAWAAVGAGRVGAGPVGKESAMGRTGRSGRPARSAASTALAERVWCKPG